MEKYTLKELLHAHNNKTNLNGVSPETLSAVSAAYWAGQSEARAEERSNLQSRVNSLFPHKFKILLSKVVDHLAPENLLKASKGLKEEYQDFLTWDFKF